MSNSDATPKNDPSIELNRDLIDGLGEFSGDEFVKYLDQCGVIDCITKALLELSECEEKPKNVLRFLVDRMMDKQMKDELEKKDSDLEEMRIKVDVLETQLADIKSKNPDETSSLSNLAKETESDSRNCEEKETIE
ncbi:MAG: hypothetical protein MHMPM18_000589 [Marteilia pararefringens]